MDESSKSYTGISSAPGNAHHTTTGSATTSTATGGPGGQHLASATQNTGIGNDSSLGQTSHMAPSSQTQPSTGVLSSMKNAIFGSSSSEPVSGVQGNTAAGQPYDAGNMTSSTHSTTGATHHTPGTTTQTGASSGGVIGSVVNAAKSAIGMGTSSSTTTASGVREGEYGPHSSRVANALDPRVDSDLDGRGTTGSHMVPGQHTSMSSNAGMTGTTGTHTGHHGVGSGTAMTGAGATGAGLAAHHAGHNNSTGTTGTAGTQGGGIIDQAKQAIGLTPSHSTTTGTTSGVREGEYGPHNSRIANALDPRVDSDLDGRGATGSGLTGTHTGSGLTGTHTGSGLTGTHTGSGLTGTHTGSGLTGTHTGSGLTGTHTSTGVREGEFGPHNSRIANALDPRVDSDLDGRGATGAHTGHHAVGTGAAMTGAGVAGAGLAGHHAGQHTGSTTGTQGGGIIDKAKQAVGLTPTHGTTTGTTTGTATGTAPTHTTGNTLGSTPTTGTSLLREAGIEPASASERERTAIHPTTIDTQKAEAERAAAMKPTHAPGQNVEYHSGGTLAEGGNFDASAPGAGPEAQRLINAGQIETLEEREAKHGHGHHGQSSGTHTGVPGTAITTTGTSATSTTGSHHHGTHYHDPSTTSSTSITTGTHHPGTGAAAAGAGVAGAGLAAHHAGHHTGATGTHSGTHTGTGLTGSHTGSGVREGEYGPHSSRIANALDPRVDSDLDGRGARSMHTGTHTGTHTGHHGVGTAAAVGTGAGLASDHVGHQTGTTGSHIGTGLTGSHTGTHTGTGLTGSHTSGVREGEYGPHSSRIANALDPRVDSDLDGRGATGAHTGTGLTGTHTGAGLTGTHTGTGLTGTHTGTGLTGTHTGAGLTGTHHDTTNTTGSHGGGIVDKAKHALGLESSHNTSTHTGTGLIGSNTTASGLPGQGLAGHGTTTNTGHVDQLSHDVKHMNLRS